MKFIVTYSTLFSFGLLTILLGVSFSAFSLVQADNVGFTVELIHKDSPNSPFFNASESPYQRLTNSLQHSARRVNQLNQALTSSNTPQATLISGIGGYLMKISIGTPPVEVLAVADTGSDLIWTECKRCTLCYERHAPPFDPSLSYTIKQVPCNASACHSMPGTYCQSNGCLYSSSFGDGSFFTRGILATDTITLGSTSGKPFPLPNTTFGCGMYNAAFSSMKGSGIVGLGLGSNSLISRMRGLIDGKFSYCLVPIHSKLSSKMNFGSNGVVSGPAVVSTPLILGYPCASYLLTLEAMSVGGERIEFQSPYSFGSVHPGNIVIDSGTTLTYLPEAFYNQLESKVSDLIYLKRVNDILGQLHLCYQTESDIGSPIIVAPIITVHFKGADVELSPLNTFIRTIGYTVCFAFAKTEGIAFYGNLAQMNFLIGYDIKSQTLSFKPTDCTK